MTSSFTLRCAAGFALAALAGRGASGADAPTSVKEPGDLWEVTSQMSMEGMEGMAMPARTNRVCSDRQWNKPPVDMSENGCQTLDYRNTPTKSTWTIRCDKPMPMTGEGEIVRSGSDAYRGWMKMTTPQGVMTMKLNGKRVGDCDAAATKAQMAQSQAAVQAQIAQAERDSAAATAQMCKVPVDLIDFKQLEMQAALCTDPGLKTALCDRVDTLDGFTLLCERRPEYGNGLNDTAKYCGKDVEAIRKKYCDDALAKESLDVLGKCCPTEAQGIAQRECAGRTYTSNAGSKYAGFCLAYARDMMAGGKDDPNAGKQETTKEKTKKSLKSLIPH